jgi:hypothetical protein
MHTPSALIAIVLAVASLSLVFKKNKAAHATGIVLASLAGIMFTAAITG